MRVSIILIGLVALGVALIVGPVQAQINDHLKCYQIKGDLKLKGLVDIDTPQFGLDPGCKITKAKFFCAPATKSNVGVVDGKTKDPITPLPLSAPPAAGDRICWRVKCPAPVPSSEVVTDQFGTQTFTKFKTKLLCTPAVKGTEFCGDGSITGTEECEPTNDSACPGLCQADCSCGVSPPTCGNGVIDGNDDCDGADLGGATCESLGFASGTLTCSVGCGLDVAACVSFSPDAFPVTGQTTAFTADKNDGIGGAVSVPDDGTVQAGAALSYTDNGDGTITDNNTGLMWEKKGDNSTLHDVDNVYRWSGDGSQETIWDWLDDINNEGGTGFAGHSDWRIPNVKELQSIVDFGVSLPTVDPVFETGCMATCTVTTCSCTAVNYWSSTSNPNGPVFAYNVSFSSGGVSNGDKSFFDFFVRAVRGGL